MHRYSNNYVENDSLLAPKVIEQIKNTSVDIGAVNNSFITLFKNDKDNVDYLSLIKPFNIIKPFNKAQLIKCVKLAQKFKNMLKYDLPCHNVTNKIKI